MTANDSKRMAAERALAYVPENETIGVGTGSTVNFFIDALAHAPHSIRAAVSTSDETTRRLQAAGIKVVSLNEAGPLPVYIDGADEANPALELIKGGGAALLAEKVVASAARQFVCIADESKFVPQLGGFALPVEVVSFARVQVAAALARMGGAPVWREGVTTLAGHQILDVTGLNFSDALALEDAINQIPGVMECGVFARNRADVLILGAPNDARILFRQPQ